MTASDIRSECAQNVDNFHETNLDSKEAVALLQYGAMMELAAQMAELNEKFALPR